MRAIAPSLLAADFGNLQHEIEMINSSQAEFLHLDIMDGVFVPNISFGTPVAEVVQKLCTKILDTHLMIVQPERYLQLFKNLGAEIITVHYEASTHLHRTIQEIKNLGMKAGVSLNPHTPIEVLLDIIQEIDLVLIMSVNPGFGGQKFIENTYHKIERLKEMILQKNATTWIEVDGGVNQENAAKLFEVGANILVAGSSVFKSPEPEKAISKLLNA